MQGKIAKWWMPDDVVFVDEIPHTATGKIQKTALREQLQGLPAADRGGVNQPQFRATYDGCHSGARRKARARNPGPHVRSSGLWIPGPAP